MYGEALQMNGGTWGLMGDQNGVVYLTSVDENARVNLVAVEDGQTLSMDDGSEIDPYKITLEFITDGAGNIFFHVPGKDVRDVLIDQSGTVEFIEFKTLEDEVFLYADAQDGYLYMIQKDPNGSTLLPAQHNSPVGPSNRVDLGVLMGYASPGVKYISEPMDRVRIDDYEVLGERATGRFYHIDENGLLYRAEVVNDDGLIYRTFVPQE